MQRDKDCVECGEYNPEWDIDDTCEECTQIKVLAMLMFGGEFNA